MSFRGRPVHMKRMSKSDAHDPSAPKDAPQQSVALDRGFIAMFWTATAITVAYLLFFAATHFAR